MKSAMAICGVIALGCAPALADRGRGSIRGADQQQSQPREAARPEQGHDQPQHAAPEARHDEHPAPEARHDDHAAPAVHVEVQTRHDWDDNDEEANHWGGFARGEPVRIVRGERVHDLPPSHVNLLFNKLAYFLDAAGAYYLQQPDGEYVVVQPPVGVVVAAIPSGATPIVVGPTTYYYLDGVYYVPQGNGFAVVNPPPGIVVPALPTGANQVVINGTVVYQFDGFNYQPSLQGGVTAYTVTPM